jgi:intracellular septation protein
MNTEATPPKKPKSGWLNLLVDYGPVLVFFLTYRHFSPANREDAIGEVLAVIKGTVSFVIASIIALIVSRWKLGRISPMLWLSTGLIVFFGGLTVLLQDAFWIQVKPTAIYLIFGIALLVGVWRGHALLRYLLEAAFEGLSQKGWMKLSRNWGVYFLCLAVLNEVLRHFFNAQNHNFGTWLSLKIWLFMPLSFIFTFAHMPMLLRHGLANDAKDDVLGDPPHE